MAELMDKLGVMVRSKRRALHGTDNSSTREKGSEPSINYCSEEMESLSVSYIKPTDLNDLQLRSNNERRSYSRS